MAGTEGVNPNEEVGAEETRTVRGGEGVTFADLDETLDAQEAAKPKRKIVTPPKKEEKKSSVKDVEPKESDDGEEGDEEKPAPKKADAKEEKPDPKDEKPKVRAKAVKYRRGEEEGSVSTDAVFTMTGEGGKKEEVTFQDLVNEWHGKGYHARQAQRVATENQKRERQVKELTGMVQRFAEIGKQDPTAGWDFLAELQGADPVELKMNVLKAQIEESREYWSLPSDEAREQWLERKRFEFDKKALDRAKKNRTADDEKTKSEKERLDLQKQFGVSDEEYDDLVEKCQEYKRQHGKEGPVTPKEVISASRWVMADSVVKDAVPHLVGRADYDKLLGDIYSHLIQHPNLSKERLAKTLRETFGQGDSEEDGPSENLKAVSQRVVKSSEADDSYRQSQGRKSKGAELFSDFED